ncbi:hypothetical protein AWC38_SpisGene10207 [Stylophora pistillata]|uniref:Uncharacterized protein n=1 Tax=Stylophora pistillata TaxID=50429 RepID=A0A2B4S831_STYPI|nr:hypothetical protein AWC38_SpisGene10207 [Stylophora pistillata]
MRQWSKAEIDSIPLLSSSAVKEINNLQHHVIKDCLSGIPTSGGTNRNEAIHKSLNTSLKWSRIGLELALVFLGLLFYKWNERKISGKLTNKRKKVTYIQPVETYRVMIEDSTTDEQFGGSLTIQENAEAADCEFGENLSDIDEAINCINYLLEEHSDTSSDDDSLSLDDQNCDISDDEDCINYLNNAEIANAIQKASNFSCLSKHLEGIKSEASFSRSANDLIHFQNALCLLSTVTNKAQYSGTDLDEFLHLNNLQRIKIPGDRNSFFVPLAFMIQQQLAKCTLNVEAKAHMEYLGLVKDYEAEANAFLQDGHFASELGNSMPLAASNALRISLVVFTGMLNFPVLPICPRDRTQSDNPIYLAYDMRFAGLYDGIEQQTTVQQDERQQRSTSPQSGNQHQVTCRGKKVRSGSAPITCSAQKWRHHNSSTEGLSGKSFTEFKAGGTMTVHWTLFEELVLMELLVALLASDKLETEVLYKEYNHVVDTVRPTAIKDCLGKKTERQVAHKLSKLSSGQKVFAALMKEQIRLNQGE